MQSSWFAYLRVVHEHLQDAYAHTLMDLHIAVNVMQNTVLKVAIRVPCDS